MKISDRVWLGILSLVASLVLSASMEAQPRSNASDPLIAQASSRIAGSIEGGTLLSLRGNRHPLARPEFDAGAAPATLPMQSMVLVLQPSPAQQAALESLLDAQRDPASPYFHQWLTPEQFAEHFGVSAEDAQRVALWLESNGFHVDEIAPSRRTITFSGNASQVERAFATSMRHYRVNGALHVANATEPSIPAALAQVVKGVLSLHDFRPQAAHAFIRKPLADITLGNTHYITPGDLAAIYNVTPLYTQGLDGSGQSVAVVGRSNINLADVRAFRASFGLPANDPQVILNGNDPGTADSGELLEATLDAEYAGALAIKSTVKFVATKSTATSDGTYLSAQYIVNNNIAPVMTMSFGLCEAQLGTAGNAYINALWQQAAAQGITVLVSSGDSGAAGCDCGSAAKALQGLAVNGLCSSPYDTCVGGTQFNDTANPSLYWATTNNSGSASALGYIPESVWNESTNGLWAGGGGSSAVYGKPAWQSGSGVPADGKRDVPDVSLAAAGHDGYMIVMNGARFIVGGTSASTPAFASILALVVQSTGARLGVANPRLYALANQTSTPVFHDVTGGNNSVPGLTGFSAAPGFDLASGLGSVDASALVANWRSSQAAPAIQLSLTQSSFTAAPASNAPITVKVTTSGGLTSPIALTTSSLPKGFTATFSPASIAAASSGSSTLQLTVAATVAPGSYSFNVQANSGSVSASSAVTATITAPALTLTASDTTVMMLPGASRAVTISSAGNSTFNSAVTLKATGLPVGVTGTFSPATIAAPGSGQSVLTLASTSAIQPGSYVVVITAAAGTITKTVQFTLNVPSLSAAASSTSVSLMRGSNASLSLTTRTAGAFNSPVSFTVSGLPTGVTAAFSPGSLPAPGVGTVSIKFTATAAASLGAVKVVITATGGGLVTTVPVTLTVAPQPTFTFNVVGSTATAPGTSVKLTPGGSAVVQFASASQNGFTSPISIIASGAPAGVTLKLSSPTITAGQGASLTISAASQTALGSANITVTATGGGQSCAVPIVLTISITPGTTKHLNPPKYR